MDKRIGDIEKMAAEAAYDGAWPLAAALFEVVDELRRQPPPALVAACRRDRIARRKAVEGLQNGPPA